MRAVAALLAGLTLVACARHEERELTAWLKVEITRPATGTSGVLVVGSNEEVFHARVGNRWQRLGSGHPTRYLLLNDPNKEYYEKDAQAAALVDLNDGKGVQVVRAGQRELRPLADAFGSAGDPAVPPSRTAVDLVECRERAIPAGCRDLRIRRYDPGGTLIKTFDVPLAETYPECQLLGIRWYDSREDPIISAQCGRSESVRCLWLIPRDEGLVVRAVGADRPPRECSESPGLNVALSNVERFEVLQ
jgi:hypothetical protein